MKIIAGLGNPGDQYADTRHNVGFWVIDEVSQRWNMDVTQKKFQSMVGQGVIHGEKVLLLKPQTYMNRSGQSVGAAASYFDVPDQDIYDDLALLPGMVRLRSKGSAGGHNGMKDIISHLGSDQFPRLRVGIGQAPPEQATADYVLGRPSQSERREIETAVLQGADAVEVWLRQGIEQAMASYNRKVQNGALEE